MSTYVNQTACLSNVVHAIQRDVIFLSSDTSVVHAGGELGLWRGMEAELSLSTPQVGGAEAETFDFDPTISHHIAMCAEAREKMYHRVEVIVDDLY